MAVLKVKQKVEDTLYVYQFDLEEISPADASLIDKFGEPNINVGGSFTTDSVAWTLPDEYVKLPSGFPVVKKVDASVAPFSTNTANRLATYRTTITARVAAAFDTLRDNTDTFTNQYLTNI